MSSSDVTYITFGFIYLKTVRWHPCCQRHKRRGTYEVCDSGSETFKNAYLLKEQLTTFLLSTVVCELSETSTYEGYIMQKF
jgi:hypothetical protein